MPRETVFTLEATPIKYGPRASREAGWEMARLGARRVMLLSDPGVIAAGITARVQERIEAEGIECELFDRVAVEPTLSSFQEAADFASSGGFDGFVGVGGGSSLDTAKVADLIATHGGDIMEWVNAPVGGGRKLPAPLQPLLAIPTTAGTGSEATTVAVLALPEERAKAGISHRYLRAHQGIVDPELTRSMPSEVTAACGLDVVCHAVESFVARPFDAREAPATPDERPPYQGANPVADIWSSQAIEYGGRYLRRAVADGDDMEARGAMMLGATMAGVGFGSAGTHIPHACSYPISTLKQAYQPPGYPDDHAFVPHGISVIVTSAAVFRYTFSADPEKHRRAAELLSGETIAQADEQTLPDLLLSLMRDVGAPSGLRELGFDEQDMDALVEGTLKQRRLLAVAPREVGPNEVAAILRESMENW